jgi:hypothetical protein
VLCCRGQGVLRDEADELRAQDSDTESFRRETYGLERYVHRRRPVVRQIHRDLHVALRRNRETQCLDRRQSAGTSPHLARNAFRQGNVRRVEQNVPGDQRLAGADGNYAGGRMHGAVADVRRAVRFGRDRVADLLELAAAQVGEVHMVGSHGGTFVEVDRNAQLAPDAVRGGSGERGGVLHRQSPNRDERHDVGGAHSRMRARMARQVDPLDGAGDTGDGRPDDGIRLTGECDHRAIVIHVGLAPEQQDSGYGCDRVDDRVDDVEIAALAEIRNALEDR